MGREIRLRYETGISGQIPAAAGTDDYKDKLLKLIPAEIIGAYLTLKSIIDSAAITEGTELIQWIVFALLLVLTPVTYIVIYKVKIFKQVAVTTFAFIIWVFTIGGPFDSLFTGSDGTILPLKGVIAGIILVFYSLIAPIFLQPKTDKS